MAWQTPKTNWGVDPVGSADFNRIEGNTEYLKQSTDSLQAQQDTLKTKVDKKRYLIAELRNVVEGRAYTITHNLGSTNVMVQALLEHGSVGWRTDVAIGHAIISANAIVVKSSHDQVTCRIIITRLDW